MAKFAQNEMSVHKNRPNCAGGGGPVPKTQKGAPLGTPFRSLVQAVRSNGLLRKF